MLPKFLFLVFVFVCFSKNNTERGKRRRPRIKDLQPRILSKMKGLSEEALPLALKSMVLQNDVFLQINLTSSPMKPFEEDLS